MALTFKFELLVTLCAVSAVLVYFYSSLSSSLRYELFNNEPLQPQHNSDNIQEVTFKMTFEKDRRDQGVKELDTNKWSSELGTRTPTLSSPGITQTIQPNSTSDIEVSSLSGNFDLDLTSGVNDANLDSPIVSVNSDLPRDSGDVNLIQNSKSDIWANGPLTVYEAIDQFREKTSPGCDNTCHDQLPGCNITQEADWNELNDASQLPYVPFLTSGQYVFSWERTYMRRPPLIDLRTLPSLTLSKVTVDNVEEDGKVRCNINDVIHGRLDVFDGYGRSRSSGDDEVRVWVTSGQPKGNSSTGDVTDLKNGSYSFAIRCLWPGNLTLNVALVYAREFIKVVIHQTRIGTTRFVAVLFQKNKTYEFTLCLGTPNIPGRACVCNMSTDGREPFYCGRPVQPELTCDDWIHTLYLGKIPVSHNVTWEEKLLVNLSAGNAQSKLFKHGISIVTENQGSRPQLLPCSMVSPAATWNMSRPKGFWNIFEWDSLLCQEAARLTSEWTLQCLTNTSVHLFGDSNTVKMFNDLLAVTKCSNITGVFEKRCWCFIPDRILNLSYTQHEMPKYGSSKRSLTVASVASALDALSSRGRHVIIVHYYLHYTAAHLTAVYQRLKSVREAIDRLVARNNEVYIGIRGPHVTYQGWTQNQAIGGDPMGTMLIEIIQTIFKGLEDKVVFLDGWDMSISKENYNIHPSSYFGKAMIKTLLSYVCG